MKKKILSAILTAALALALTGCGEETSSADEKSSAPAVSESSAEPADSAPEPEKSSEIKQPYITSSEEKSSEQEPEYSQPDRPKLIETRLYVDKENHSWNYYIEIYDNGGWSISQEKGNMEIYAGYSFEEEAAGAYVTVQSYNLAFDPPQNQFEGNARFTMTEETLEVLFENAKEPDVFYRYSLDEPLY